MVQIYVKIPYLLLFGVVFEEHIAIHCLSWQVVRKLLNVVFATNFNSFALFVRRLFLRSREASLSEKQSENYCHQVKQHKVKITKF